MYMLLADQHSYGCRTWDELVERLAWARGQGYRTAKARQASGYVDRPLIPSECAALVEAATALALAVDRSPPQRTYSRSRPKSR